MLNQEALNHIDVNAKLQPVEPKNRLQTQPTLL